MKHRLALSLILASALIASAQLRSDKEQIQRSLNIFTSLFKEVQLNYVDSLDAAKAIDTAIEYMLDEIDPYTEYYSPSDTEELSQMATGDYAGVGAIINKGRDGRVRFAEPYDNTPSWRAGIRGGDIILRIDTIDITTAHTVSDVSSRLRGLPGTRLTVDILRPYAADSLLTVDIVREKIHTPAVPFSGLVGPGNNVGYITISSFTDKAPEETRRALLQLLDQGATSLVIDVQANPGGLLESAVDILGLFLPRGTKVVETRGRGGKVTKVYKTDQKPIAPNLPLAILIDEQSASAAEILAGTLQDLDRAVIIGKRSYGKGLVQSTSSLPYDAAVKITTGKYYIPSGRLIQAIDYSRRNPDGSVARTPDSLTTAYRTLHGREVRDGGGITPDITVKRMESSLLVYNISVGSYDIDYATCFAADNATIPSAGQFQITDSIISDFVDFLNDEKMTYESAYGKTFDSLRDVINVEHAMNDSVAAHLSALESALKPDLRRDIDRNRRQVEYILLDAIVPRYYHRRGAIEATLPFNEALQEAVAILSDNKRYKEILK